MGHPSVIVDRSGERGRRRKRLQDELRGWVLPVAPEELASVQVEEEDRQDEDDDERSGKEEDHRQKAGLVGWKLLKLHAALDAVAEERWQEGWNRGAVSRIMVVKQKEHVRCIGVW
jgi:hypothetical protein